MWTGAEHGFCDRNRGAFPKLLREIPGPSPDNLRARLLARRDQDSVCFSEKADEQFTDRGFVQRGDVVPRGVD